MDKENLEKFIDAAIAKAGLVNTSSFRFFLLSLLSGIYVGFGIVLIFSIGAPLKAAGAPGLKALMGASFALALTLVIFTGSELFTGNNMTMVIGNLSKKVSWLDTLKVWGVSFLGNLIGSLLLALTMIYTGLILKSPLKEFILSASADKMNAPFSELFFRGILCNMLVCLAIWTSSRAREEIARLVLIFWCLFGFIGTGFEHSIANMTLLGMGVLLPHDPNLVSWKGFIMNLLPVTLGNIFGGAVCIGAAYWYLSTNKRS
ncbi:MAG: formate/nitrite transporter family protein [Clostridia bacterium]|nr:formate/nitrite transporter family protein [Clostridia bacterium]